MRSFLITLLVLISAGRAFSQCTTLGQTPPTAFPVCGTATFTQQTVPLCTTNDLFVPGCSGDGADYANKNPFWYKFTCFQAGTLGFVITPLGNADDYDWQLYDVTGLDPNEVYTNQNIIVAGNWSGSYGPTGASDAGVPYIQCASDPSENRNKFSKMPQLILGHNYLLLISHFSDNQTGYTLAFGGGTAVITDPLEPHLKTAKSPCAGDFIRITTNKKVKCNTLAADGTDFIVTTASNNTILPISATSYQCSNGFDMDTITVFFATPLPLGTYTVKIKTGSDGNTLKDNCDRLIPENESFEFSVFPLIPTPLDSVTPPKCAPQTVELVFDKLIKCSSIDPAGGDFVITGPYPVAITGAVFFCDRGETDKITLQLSAPMLVGGDFIVKLQTGPDGTSIIDECGLETPVPNQTTFHVSDTVNANFTYTIDYSCAKNTVFYTHDGANGVNAWHWSFGTAPDNFTQNPAITYFNFEDKNTRLIVSNGVCSDTADMRLSFANYVNANFDVTPLVCPAAKVDFKNNSEGTGLTYQWTYGNGLIQTVKDPAPQTYPILSAADYTAFPELIVTNNFNCKDTIRKPVQVVYSCFITVPSAFTPNGDGLNDYLYPLKAYKSSNLTFSIFNRFGQRIFYSTSWLDKWDGRYRGLKQDPGTYVWMLDYDNLESGRHVFQKGTSILIR